MNEMIVWDGKTGHVEASTLGLNPGEWPRKLTVGNLQLHRKEQIIEDGVILAWFYKISDGRIVLVYND